MGKQKGQSTGIFYSIEPMLLIFVIVLLHLKTLVVHLHDACLIVEQHEQYFSIINCDKLNREERRKKVK